MATKQNGWIAFDLDGTLAHYDGWQGPEHIGEPIPEMVALLKNYLQMGFEVRIFTARVSNGIAGSVMNQTIRKAIEDWCVEHLGTPLTITNVKDFAMLELYDDRCIQVLANSGLSVQHRIAQVIERLSDPKTYRGMGRQHIEVDMLLDILRDIQKGSALYTP